MTDATTRQHARPHLDADPLEVALEAWRRGQPCDLPTLTRAGAITIGQAHEAWRAGLWAAPECEYRPAMAPVAMRSGSCPLCLGTSYLWSERHAELLAYAGEVVPNWRPGPGVVGPGSLGRWLEILGTFSTLAPLAAAWGVASAWHVEGCGGVSAAHRREHRRALDAVWRYLCDPSKGALRGRLWGPDANPPNRLAVSATGLVGEAEAWSLGAIIRDSAAALGEEATSRAAREGVRRWAGRVWGVESRIGQGEA